MGGWIRVKCLYCLQTIAELHNVKIRVKEKKTVNAAETPWSNELCERTVEQIEECLVKIWKKKGVCRGSLSLDWAVSGRYSLKNWDGLFH